MNKIFVLPTLILSIVASTASMHADDQYQYVDFAQSMDGVKHSWGKFFKKDKQWMTIVRNHYEQHNPNKIAEGKELKIPKIVHQIWIGSPFPEKYREWQQSWLEHHPDWTYMLWTDKEVAELTMQNRDKYEKAFSFGTKTDILRAEILYQYGGVYVDTDFECFKPLDGLNHTYSFYFSLLPEKYFTVCNALMACSPGHPVIKGILDSVYVPEDNTWQKVSLSTGPFLTTKVFMNYVTNSGDQDWMVFPCSYFFPMPPGVPASVSSKKYIKPETYGLHHYEGSWID